MNKIYKAKKIYVLKLAKVTEVSYSGLERYTTSRKLPELYFGKLVKTEKHCIVPDKHFYKLISTGTIVHDRHDHANEGDLYVVEKTPLNMLLDKPTVFVDRKSLINTEKAWREDSKKEKEMTK